MSGRGADSVHLTVMGLLTVVSAFIGYAVVPNFPAKVGKRRITILYKYTVLIACPTIRLPSSLLRSDSLSRIASTWTDAISRMSTSP